MIQVWGHRGARGFRPENTMASFEEAYKQGADGIELDVHLSSDGYLIVCHDELLDRTTDGSGWIKNYSFGELRNLDAGSWYEDTYYGERLPVLEEVLEFLKNNLMYLDIEIKAGSVFYEGIEEKTLAAVYKYGMQDRVIISSFDHYAIKKIKELDSNIKTGILYSEALYRPYDYMTTVGADAIHPNYRKLTDEVIREAKNKNVPINAFTVNDMNDVKILAGKGINAIITDYPGNAIKALRDK